MKHTLVICDKDKQYAYKIAGYINNKPGFPFEVRVPDSLDEIVNKKTSMNIDLFLVDEDVAEEFRAYVPGTDTIYLSGNSLKREGFKDMIYKYQSVDGMIKEILLYASSRDDLKNLISRKSQMKIIGLFSPIGRSGQTGLGLAVGQLLSRDHRTLFISMDCYGSISEENVNIPWSGDLSDLLYSVNNDSKDIATLIGGASGSLGSLDIMPPMDRHNDLISITFDEWKSFLRHIEDHTDYDFVILDLSKAIQGLTEMIALCSKLIVTVTDEENNRKRLNSFMKEIETIENIKMNTDYISIPEDNLSHKRSIKGVSDGLLEYAREVVKEIVA